MAQDSPKTEKKPRKEASGAAKAYLIAYNGIQTIGWSYIFYKLITFYLSPSTKTLYETVACSLFLFQNAAVLEVVHAAIKLVPSSPIITAVQVASRVMVVCGVLYATTAAKASVGLHLCLWAWGMTEIIRYANYTLNLVGAVPYFLVWLRYSTFLILYPLGITGELLCLYAAQKEVGQTGLLSISMPNALNFIFSYQYFLIYLMLLYIPIFPRLFIHMLAQRIKVLGPSKLDKKTK